MSYNPPHPPCDQVPSRYAELYDDDVETYCEGIPNILPKGTKGGDLYRRDVKNYYGAISGIDEHFGRILDCLKENELADDTIVVFTSDHGHMSGRHIDWDNKNMPWEESMNIPFMIRWPGKIAARHDDLLLSTADIYPTLMGLLGLDVDLPEDLEGASHAGLFLGEDEERPTSQLYMHVEEPSGDLKFGRRGVRTHQYTLCIETMTSDIPKISPDDVHVMLYDREADPYQLHNIADKDPERVSCLIETELKPWLDRTRDPWAVPSL